MPASSGLWKTPGKEQLWRSHFLHLLKSPCSGMKASNMDQEKEKATAYIIYDLRHISCCTWSLTLGHGQIARHREKKLISKWTVFPWIWKGSLAGSQSIFLSQSVSAHGHEQTRGFFRDKESLSADTCPIPKQRQMKAQKSWTQLPKKTSGNSSNRKAFAAGSSYENHQSKKKGQYEHKIKNAQHETRAAYMASANEAATKTKTTRPGSYHLISGISKHGVFHPAWRKQTTRTWNKIDLPPQKER